MNKFGALATLLTTMAVTLAPIRKAEGAPVEPNPPPPPPPASQPAPEQPADLAKVLEEASKALAELAKKTEGAELPQGGAEVCSAVIKALMAICPPTVPGDAVKRLTKFELDNYTASIVTFNAMQSKFWAVSDLLRENKMSEAVEMMKSISEMINSVVSQVGSASAAPAAETTKMVKVQFTPAQLVAWLNEQTSLVATDAPDVAQKRLACVADVVEVAKELHFESASPDKPIIAVEISEAYVGTAGKGGTKEDLTTTSDQGSKEMQPVEPAGSDATNFATNAVKLLGSTVSALVAQHNATQAPGSTSFAKRLQPKGGFAWPMDMANAEFNDKDEPVVEADPERW